MRLPMIGITLALTAIFATPPAVAGEALTGTFKGAGDFAAAGTVQVTAGSVDIQDDFTFSGAPDPKIGFGKDGQFDISTIIEPLKANDGAQSYAIPDSIDVTAYNEVYVWCEQYSIPLGIAKLQ